MVAVVVSASSVQAEPVLGVKRHERGTATGIGLGFLAASFLSGGLGIAGLINSGLAAQTLNASFPGAPSGDEASTYRQLIDQNQAGSALAAIGFIGAGAFLVTSIILLIVDRPQDVPVSLGFAPTTTGGAFSFGMTF